MDEILTCEAALQQAMLSNDVAALDQLIDPDLVFTTLEGTIMTKAMDLEAHRTRRLQLTRLDPSERIVQWHGTTAVVSVRMDVAGTFDGAAIDGALRYTRVWCQRPEGWRIVAGHMSALPSSASPSPVASSSA
jgi:ketosteroid isomerase-like protein